MKLTPQEQQVILEEAERAKEAVFSRLTLQWSNGILSGVQIVQDLSKDEIRARLDPKSRVLMERGGKVLTQDRSGS